MKRAALLVLCLAIAGCGEEEVESGACASGLQLHGVTYWGASVHGLDMPPPGRRVGSAVEPACNDSGPPFGQDREVTVQVVSGVPQKVAVYEEGDEDSIYLSERYHLFLPWRAERRGARGRPCRVTTIVSEVRDLRLARSGRDWFVRYDERTRFDGFDGALPYLRAGDRVQVDAVGCGGASLVARRIALQP